MDGGKYAYLVCVDGEINHNKFYEMKQVDRDTFIAAYGREGKTRKEHTYRMWDWDDVYRKKTRKSGSKKSYTDVTHLRGVQVVEDGVDDVGMSGIADASIRGLMMTLQQFASGSVAVNYKVSSSEVTPQMIEEANDLLAQISGLIYTPDIQGVTNRDINDLLEQLYMAVPRAMHKVQEHMLPFTRQLDVELAKQLFNEEQSNIDVMESQVHVVQSTQDTTDEVEQTQSVLDSMGITIRVASADEARLAKRIGDSSLMGRVYVVENKTTQVGYDQRMAIQAQRGHPHDQVALYWHGSRNENWLSILRKGLLIRPPRATSTGDMFGIGIYFADLFKKAYGYTSHRGSYWADGRADTGFMALYNVNIGKQYSVKQWERSHYELCLEGLERKGGYDSTWGRSGPSLINNEYIIYRPDQCTVAYLVQIK
jgi:poly [ADP-ribose] polymerase